MIASPPVPIIHLETPHAFRAWLAEHDETAIVGSCGNARLCPIAEFLRAMHPHVRHIFVMGDHFWLDDVAHALGEWAVTFIGAIDDLGGEGMMAVTRDAALEILDRVAPQRIEPIYRYIDSQHDERCNCRGCNADGDGE